MPDQFSREKTIAQELIADDLARDLDESFEKTAKTYGIEGEDLKRFKELMLGKFKEGLGAFYGGVQAGDSGAAGQDMTKTGEWQSAEPERVSVQPAENYRREAPEIPVESAEMTEAEINERKAELLQAWNILDQQGKQSSAVAFSREMISFLRGCKQSRDGVEAERLADLLLDDEVAARTLADQLQDYKVTGVHRLKGQVIALARKSDINIASQSETSSIPVFFFPLKGFDYTYAKNIFAGDDGYSVEKTTEPAIAVTNHESWVGLCMATGRMNERDGMPTNRAFDDFRKGKTIYSH